MKKYPYKAAKEIITSICTSAQHGHFDTREKFLAMLDKNPHIAAQGYNPHGRIFFWNDASTLLYGHGDGAAINQDLVELILPREIRPLARDMIAAGAKTGKMPEAGSCDLVRCDGSFITVYSGHMVFKWDGSCPEFYCVDLPIDAEEDV